MAGVEKVGNQGREPRRRFGVGARSLQANPHLLGGVILLFLFTSGSARDVSILAVSVIIVLIAGSGVFLLQLAYRRARADHQTDDVGLVP